MNDVTRNIKAFRKRENLTQDELAEKLHVTRQAVSNWENGKTQPDIDTLMSLAEALDCDASELIYGEKKTKAPYKKIQKKYLLIVFICAAVIYEYFPLERYGNIYASLHFEAKYQIAACMYLELAWAAAAVLILSAFSLFAEISLYSNRSRKMAWIIASVCMLFMIAFWILFFTGQSRLSQNIVLSFVIIRIFIYFPAAICGAAVFLALNNKKSVLD